MISSGSVIASYRKLVSANNGIHNNMYNKCGVISIGCSMGIDSQNYIDLITEMLQLDIGEKLDFNLKKIKIQNICNLLEIGIYVHCAKKLDRDMIRIWRSSQMEFIPPTIKNMDIHILWYGDHFEYVDWNRISDYPEYNEAVYKLAKKNNGKSADDLLYQYNVIYSTISM